MVALNCTHCLQEGDILLRDLESLSYEETQWLIFCTALPFYLNIHVH